MPRHNTFSNRKHSSEHVNKHNLLTAAIAICFLHNIENHEE
jgi:hypothetical protein